MRMIVLFLLIVLAVLQYKFWMGADSLPNWLKLEQKLKTQDDNNKQLTARNQALQADIIELKSNDQALEEQARYELGMVKEGETYYQFVE